MASASPPPEQQHQQWAAEVGMDTPPPQHHHQQQQAHAGPDQELMEVKALLQQALGGAGILNHVKVRLSQKQHFHISQTSPGTEPLTLDIYPSQTLKGIARRRSPSGHGWYSGGAAI